MEARFWSQIDKSGDCWLWTGKTNGSGYGVFAPGTGKSELAHRFGHVLLKGPIPSGHRVLHGCDTPRCVLHTFTGTQQDNIDDMRAKGRMPLGEKRAFAKLTADDVREIRRTYATGEADSRELAQRYAVSPCTILKIIHRKKWKHV